MAITKPSKNRGLSLIELMVGVVIGMIAIIIIMQVAITFEAQKRTTVGTAGAMDEGSVGLFTLRREIQSAGYGMADPDLINCPIKGYAQLIQCKAGDPTPPPGQYFNFRLLPILITQGVDGAPDSIAVNYSNSPMMATASTLQRKFEGNESGNSEEEVRFKMSNRYGFNLGDVVVLSHPLAVDAANNRFCSFYEVTGLIDEDEIEHKLACYTKPGAILPDSSRFNKDGGLYPDPLYPATAPIYPGGSKVFNLGGNPASNVFVVTPDGKLVINNQLTPGALPTVLFENVISFQAQYGFDARPGAQVNLQVPAQDYASDGPLGAGGFSDIIQDADNSGTAGDTGDWLRMGAVRIAIVVRNQYPDRPDPGTGLCNTTTTPPTWTWGVVPSLAMAAQQADWQCYRYKVFESVIPLRNMFWKARES